MIYAHASNPQDIDQQAARGKTEAEAYAQLRQMAMAWRISFEQAAARVVARFAGDGGGDERSERG